VWDDLVHFKQPWNKRFKKFQIDSVKKIWNSFFSCSIWVFLIVVR
jgi:hypothetical protein